MRALRALVAIMAVRAASSSCWLEMSTSPLRPRTTPSAETLTISAQRPGSAGCGYSTLQTPVKRQMRIFGQSTCSVQCHRDRLLIPRAHLKGPHRTITTSSTGHHNRKHTGAPVTTVSEVGVRSRGRLRSADDQSMSK